MPRCRGRTRTPTSASGRRGPSRETARASLRAGRGDRLRGRSSPARGPRPRTRRSLANDDTYTTPYETRLRVDAPGLSSRTTSTSSASRQLVVKTAHGKLNWHDDGRIDYQPDDGFSGTDHFNYQLTSLLLVQEHRDGSRSRRHRARRRRHRPPADPPDPDPDAARRHPTPTPTPTPDADADARPPMPTVIPLPTLPDLLPTPTPTPTPRSDGATHPDPDPDAGAGSWLRPDRAADADGDAAASPDVTGLAGTGGGGDAGGSGRARCPEPGIGPAAGEDPAKRRPSDRSMSTSACRRRAGRAERRAGRARPAADPGRPGAVASARSPGCRSCAARSATSGAGAGRRRRTYA